MEIRTASAEDAREILNIYAPYVEKTAVSFEYTVPTLEEFRARIVKTLAEYPYIVAEDGGVIVGYAYAGIFHGREAYKHSAETSIYVDEAHHCRGIGRMLYGELERILLKQNVFTLCACIATPDGKPDSRLTDSSERFHEKMGYKLVGKHSSIGYKFGKWYSIVWMEKDIGEKSPNPQPFIKFSELDSSCK